MTTRTSILRRPPIVLLIALVIIFFSIVSIVRTTQTSSIYTRAAQLGITLFGPRNNQTWRFSYVGRGAYNPPFRVRIDGKYGFINTDGRVVIPPIYDYADPGFSNGRARVSVGGDRRRSGRLGTIDINGVFVATPTRAGIQTFSSGLAAARSNSNKYGYRDTKGSWAIRPQYDAAQPFLDQHAIVGFRSLRDMIIGSFLDVGLHPDWSIIDKSGNIVLNNVPNRHILINNAFEFPLAIVDNGKWGFVTRVGDVVQLDRFDQTRSFSEGFAAVKRKAVKRNGKWGFVDQNYKTVIPYIYDDAHFFRQNMAEVHRNGKLMYINRDGDVVWTP